MSPQWSRIALTVSRAGAKTARSLLAEKISQRVGAFEHRPLYCARQPIVERPSRESPAFAPDFFSPCSKALAWPHVRWSYPRQSSSRACTVANSRRRAYGASDARPTAAAGGERATRAMSAPRDTSSRPFASERFSPRALAPAAPPLPARYAIRRDRSDESALSPRRSTLPANPAPR